MRTKTGIMMDQDGKGCTERGLEGVYVLNVGDLLKSVVLGGCIIVGGIISVFNRK